MFDINLLARPGLQVPASGIELTEESDREGAILSRLRTRAMAEAPPVAPPSTKAKSKLWLWLLLILVITIAAVIWLYPGLSWKQVREILPFRETLPSAEVARAAVQSPGSCAVILAQFLGDLPSRATIDFIDAGGGILTYRISGTELNQSLLQLNAAVEGHQLSDLIEPAGVVPPDTWLGTVVFTCSDQVGAVRPIKSEYERFFHQLKDKIRGSGGVIVDTVPGIMTAGEYVLRGSLDDMRAHLATTADDSSDVYYHRMSLLKQDRLAADPYLLRVIFNLIEERLPSPRPSSPEDTGA